LIFEVGRECFDSSCWLILVWLRIIAASKSTGQREKYLYWIWAILMTLLRTWYDSSLCCQRLLTLRQLITEYSLNEWWSFRWTVLTAIFIIDTPWLFDDSIQNTHWTTDDSFAELMLQQPLVVKNPWLFDESLQEHGHWSSALEFQ
jgi:hypothetical protein